MPHDRCTLTVERTMMPQSSTDVFTVEKRSAVMRAVKGRDTKPEIRLRKALFARGFRYRLHVKSLPGAPDIVFPGRRAVIFVHGCFWHGHDCKRGSRTPKQNADYWREKIARNKARDARQVEELRSAGWRVLTVWECELKDFETALDQATAFLKAPSD